MYSHVLYKCENPSLDARFFAGVTGAINDKIGPIVFIIEAAGTKVKWIIFLGGLLSW